MLYARACEDTWATVARPDGRFMEGKNEDVEGVPHGLADVIWYGKRHSG